MYICKHFNIRELVDPKTFEQMGDNAWKLFNDNLLRAIDDLRDFFTQYAGQEVPITVNNWCHGGPEEFRGFRPAWCKVGAPLSQHRIGDAVDCDIRGYSAIDARKIIMDNKDHPLLKLIMRLEGGVPWVHLDCKPVLDRIHIFQKT